MKTLDQVTKEFIVECDEDYVGLWSLIKNIKRAYLKISKDEQQKIVKEIVEPLLVDGIIVAGNPDVDSEEFKFNIMTGTSDEVMNYIISEWDKLGREPDIGDIIWFTKK